MERSPPDFHAILSVFEKNHVDYIVIGGVCAVLQGAPVSTFDLDLVHSRDPANLKRLITALKDLGAFYREHEIKRLIPDEKKLAAAGHHLLMTRAGPLDLIGTVTKDRGYDELLEHSLEMTIDENLKIRILDLVTLIKIKEETGFDKDRAVLPILRRTLEEKNNAGQ